MFESTNNTPALYTELNHVGALRSAAARDGKQVLAAAARQFEALFVQMMLKSMRDAGLGDSLLQSDQSELYRDLYDKQLSLHLSDNGGGIGLARMMVQQLRTTLADTGEGAAEEVSNLTMPQRKGDSFEIRTNGVKSGEVVENTAGVEKSRRSATAGKPNFNSPDEFVATLAPYASRAAKRLGVDPKALIAQAALETGWGRAVIKNRDGSSSFNMFNIKASRQWSGEKVAIQTLEYRQGVAAREAANFRAYQTVEESFNDYVDLIANSPRYADALKQGNDAEQYIEALHQAGYATDPAYARKIKQIMRRDSIVALDSFKETPSRTLT
ncbi:MAG: flagellar assembly peptidoglycan hydrolase FlgJ [Chromatiales bacterium]|nr:flagellar assembly peptidoglycan hydrolase FlgJ [Chromatiales bacterium]